jgi:hypothetical protein
MLSSTTVSGSIYEQVPNILKSIIIAGWLCTHRPNLPQPSKLPELQTTYAGS